MSMRDLIPWSRQSSAAPAVYREEDRNPFLSLRHDIDRLFEDVFRGSLPSLGVGRGSMSWPSVEVGETDREIRITAELPGLSDKDVEVLVEDGVLTLRGEKKSETEDKDRGYSERLYGRFERRIALPRGVDHQEARRPSETVCFRSRSRRPKRSIVVSVSRSIRRRSTND